jgi:8-oxo-dGTP pyrophosphatase MutT (NUDIX family)
MKIKNEKGEIMKAGGIILNDKNEILLLTIPERDIWSYPKGHMEENETDIIAAKREVLEETGWSVEIVRRLSDVTYTNQETLETIRIHMFLMKPLAKMNDGEEGIVKNWFSIEDAKDKLSQNLTFLLEEI